MNLLSLQERSFNCLFMLTVWPNCVDTYTCLFSISSLLSITTSTLVGKLFFQFVLFIRISTYHVALHHCNCTSESYLHVWMHNSFHLCTTRPIQLSHHTKAMTSIREGNMCSQNTFLLYSAPPDLVSLIIIYIHLVFLERTMCPLVGCRLCLRNISFQEEALLTFFLRSLVQYTNSMSN